MERTKSSNKKHTKHLRIPWNIYESALLLDTYLRIERGDITRKYAVSELSTDLREMAINQGIKIDDVYRNENGISMHLYHMMYALTDGKSGLANTAKVYYQIVQIYREDYKHYEKILQEAKRIIGKS